MFSVPKKLYSMYLVPWLFKLIHIWRSICGTFLLFNKGKGHGSGCITALSGVHRYLYCVYCRTPPTSLYSDNTQNLHRSTVEWISRQRHHPRSKCWQHTKNCDLSVIGQKLASQLGHSRWVHTMMLKYGVVGSHLGECLNAHSNTTSAYLIV